MNFTINRDIILSNTDNYTIENRYLGKSKRFNKLFLLKSSDERVYEIIPCITKDNIITYIIPNTFNEITFSRTDIDDLNLTKLWLISKTTDNTTTTNISTEVLKNNFTTEEVSIDISTLGHDIELKEIINDRVYVIDDHNKTKQTSTKIIIDKINIMRNIISIMNNNNSPSYIYKAIINNKPVKVKVAI